MILLEEIWMAGLAALFLWWFSTGAILIAVRRADAHGGHAHAMNVILAIPLLVLGLVAVGGTAGSTSIPAIYTGFVGALAIWGFVELTFLSGVLTGPERRPCPPGLAGRARFMRAVRTVAWHELALLAGFLTVAVLTRGAENSVGFFAYMVLFIARILAKLNLYFGVPRINTEFVPRPLQHLTSYFRRGPITPVFAVAITILSFGLACCVRGLWLADTAHAGVSLALLSALTGLALVEHWLMVLPLPDAKLWRWMLPAPSDMTPNESKTHGL